jgi:hypothetical protein
MFPLHQLVLIKGLVRDAYGANLPPSAVAGFTLRDDFRQNKNSDM